MVGEQCGDGPECSTSWGHLGIREQGALRENSGALHVLWVKNTSKFLQVVLLESPYQVRVILESRQRLGSEFWVQELLSE